MREEDKNSADRVAQALITIMEIVGYGLLAYGFFQIAQLISG